LWNLGGVPQPGVTRLFTGFAGSEASNGPAPLFRLSTKTSEIHRASEFITFVEFPGASNWQGSGLRSSCSGPDMQAWFMPRGRTLHRTRWNYLFADAHVAAYEPGETPDPQFGATFKQTMATMAVYGSESQPASLPQFKVPFVPAGAAEFTGSADPWWGGMWSGFASIPKGAQPPRPQQ